MTKDGSYTEMIMERELWMNEDLTDHTLMAALAMFLFKLLDDTKAPVLVRWSTMKGRDG